MTACTHGQPLWHHLAPGDRCPACRTIVADDASPALLAAGGAVSLEGPSPREGSRPATIATGVAATSNGADGPPPVVSGPGSPIADPATPTVTPCPVPLAAARDTLSAQAHTVAGSAPHAGGAVPPLGPSHAGQVANPSARGKQGKSAKGGEPAYMGVLHGSPTPPASPAFPAARLTDPDTAHEAAASVTDVQRRKVYQAVLEALMEHGPSTDHDLARYVSGKLGHPIGQTSVGVRRGELCREPFGFVCNSGHKGKTPTGATAIRWALTPAGINAATGVAA